MVYSADYQVPIFSKTPSVTSDTKSRWFHLRPTISNDRKKRERRRSSLPNFIVLPLPTHQLHVAFGLTLPPLQTLPRRFISNDRYRPTPRHTRMILIALAMTRGLRRLGYKARMWKRSPINKKKSIRASTAASKMKQSSLKKSSLKQSSVKQSSAKQSFVKHPQHKPPPRPLTIIQSHGKKRRRKRSTIPVHKFKVTLPLPQNHMAQGTQLAGPSVQAQVNTPEGYTGISLNLIDLRWEYRAR
ncbi:hypothetical protein CPB84DRAFT_1828072 [Gymnopilus junonius]|uniref:Uncharacterized protein n=1 Tax=Gymnopilus junonius TaxID=109634 RepID=A0A9P5THE8_GYMJU|nr:hypothetical protein CPB84DRAFT_1828072 [Gymnopilus junonius]